jgi:iron complex outermembrane recepter protein
MKKQSNKNSFKKFQLNPLFALTTAIALASGSQAVYAQQVEQTTLEQAAIKQATVEQATEEKIEEVVVTGFRLSLENSIAAKRSSDSVVEAIYAEDIGKLPDTSVAESLARLPGLAGERRNGRTSGISVRGFNENYVATTLNGRELLGIGDNRGVEYDLYPSEILSGAVVHKSTNASLLSQGLGGTVDLQTMRPLKSDRVISFNAHYEQNGLKSGNSDFDDHGHRAAFTYSDKFADDTIGAAITLATMESPSQEEQFRAWGDTSWASGDTDGDNIPDAAVLGGHDSFVRSAMMERDTIAGVLQFEPNDTISIALDALNIDFKDSKVFRGVEEAVAWGAPNNTYTNVVNGLALAGETSGFRSVIRNDAETKDAKLTTFGLNVKYQITDKWSLTLDAATGNSEKDLLNLESYSGVGRAGSLTQGVGSARSYVVTSKGVKFGPHSTLTMPDYSDPSIIKLAGPQEWGGAIAPVYNNRNDAQDGFINNPSFEEDLDTLRLQANGDIEFSVINGIELGVNVSDRTKSKINYGAFLTSPEYFAADGSIDGGDGPIPTQFIRGQADLGFIGIGNIIAYDSEALYRSGYYRELPAGEFQNDRLGDTYEVTERVSTAYIKANLDYGIMTGNVGVQVVNADQNATGFNTYTGSINNRTIAIPVKEGKDYNYVLPSMNLNFQLTDNQKVRFAAAKTASRPRMDDMKPNNTIGFNFDNGRRSLNDPEFSAWSGEEGNGELQPTEANQYDLSYEYYFADDGYVSASYFYKDIKNWAVKNVVYTDFTPYFIPGYHDNNMPVGTTYSSFVGKTSAKLDGGDGFVKGYELQASIPFHLISDALDGFGLIASGSFLEGEVRDTVNDKLPIPGLSKESLQLTAYFERSGFEFRVSGRKRSSFASEEPGLSLKLNPSKDLGAELWDAQIGYNFSESNITSLDGLTVTLQAQNITNEATVLAVESDSRQIQKYQNFGANYLLGFNYKF